MRRRRLLLVAAALAAAACATGGKLRENGANARGEAEKLFAKDPDLTRPEDALLAESLELGVRRRRFEYTAPAQWQPLPAGLMTEWFPPGFPGDVAVLTVYPTMIRQHAGRESDAQRNFIGKGCLTHGDSSTAGPSLPLECAIPGLA